MCGPITAQAVNKEELFLCESGRALDDISANINRVRTAKFFKNACSKFRKETIRN
jgi:hypothetical protein